MFVGGVWREGEGTGENLVINPTTEQILARTVDASPEQIRSAFYAARESQRYWHFEVQEQEKEAIFRRVAQYLDEARGPLAWVMIQEAGKLWRWAEAEVQETIDTVWHYHGEISRMYGEFSRAQLAKKYSITVREPYGVIVGITPWNFPLAVPSWKIFAALAGGNAIVVKAAEQTPTTLSFLCYFVHRAIRDILGEQAAYQLGGIFQVIHGKGESVGKMILEKADYDKVMFTGGTETGAIVGQIVGSRGKPISCELGGRAAIVLLEDYDVDRAVTEAIIANCGDSGQRCVSTRAVFVQESRYKDFVSRYVEEAKALRIGDPSDWRTFMGPLVSKEQLERVHRDVCRTGGKLLLGGSPLKDMGSSGPLSYPNVDPDAWQRGYFYPPTLIEVSICDLYHNYAMNNEIFGPVLAVMPFRGRNKEEIIWEAIRLLNESPYGLSNALLTNDLEAAFEAIMRVKTGILYIGRGTTGAEVGKPFGGVKASGYGREGKGLDEVTQPKQVYVDVFGRARMAQAGEKARVMELIRESEAIGKLVFSS